MRCVINASNIPIPSALRSLLFTQYWVIQQSIEFLDQFHPRSDIHLLNEFLKGRYLHLKYTEERVEKIVIRLK